ncbi:MAG: Phosphoenolpyruvate-protein phosphotransferase [Chlamydiae bacterium]|nr:Phosphoenolpyruvate-protein phosphotransferase [Chlamydiota bacterium]
MKDRLKKEIRIQGAPVSEGIAIGSAYFLKPIEEDIPDFEISLNEVDSEVARYRKALFSSKEDLNRLRSDLEMEASEEAITTIETHIQMLDDPMMTTHMEGEIRKMLRNTESVFHSVINEYEGRFTERTDSFFQERLVDVKDVSKRILGHLRDKQYAQLSEIPTGSIVFSKEIAPSYTAAAHAAQIGAFVTKNGGGNSHAALIARSKGIPYVTSVDMTQLERFDIEALIVDGYEGIIIVNPTPETLSHYQEKQKQLITRYQTFIDEDHLKSETIDGYSIQLFVNVGNPQDLDIFPYNHDGVGLFRTEYLFLQTKEFYPSEIFQQKIYRELIDKMNGRPVVIRVFDLGGDKNPTLFLDRQYEPNPILGNRGIRFLLSNIELFKMQLRAIFKASIRANVHLLLPLISDINELHTSKEIIEEVKAELRKEYSEIPDLPIGCMIEVPSAVMICDALALACDFLSMGTNDLVQYTLGVDRGNPAMSELYYPAHPSVLRMIKMISIEAKRKETPLTICGEIASNTLFTPLLLGLGLREFSLAPRYVPHVKQTIRKWSILETYDLAEEALKFTDPKDISALLTEAQKK